MPRYVCKFQDGDEAYYLDWSTIVDAPITCGMSLEDFKEYYRVNYGGEIYINSELVGRLRRVEEKGTSAKIYNNLDELIRHNRAGKNETCLSKDQIIEWYCRRVEECSRGDPCPILGVDVFAKEGSDT